jgi:hypothetical protein
MTTVVKQRGDGLVRIATALVLWKVFVLLLALASPLLFPEFWNDSSYWGNFHWPRQAPPTLATRLATWDAQHYLYLASEGYAAGQRSIAFFPLYPWSIRAVAALPGVGPLGAALVIANVLSLAGCLLLHRFLARSHPGAEDVALVLLLASPGALFFHFPYTEGLFLFLAVVAIAAAVSDRPLLAGAAAFLLALTRPNGVLIVAPLAWAAVARWRRDGRIPRGYLLAAVAPLLGLGAYLAFMRVATGHALAGFDMQNAYNAGRSFAQFLDPLRLLRDLVDVRVIHGPLYSLIDRVIFLIVIATLLPLWRLDRLLFWYALPMALVGPLSGSMVSYTRFAAVLFPCHLVLARALDFERRRPWLWLTLAVAFALQIVLLIRHVAFRWAG